MGSLLPREGRDKGVYFEGQKEAHLEIGAIVQRCLCHRIVVTFLIQRLVDTKNEA